MLTFYYIDTTIERSGMRIEAQQATPAFQSIEQTPPVAFVWRHEDIEGTFEGEGTDIDPDPDFVDDPDADGLGVSFSGVTSLENTYHVE
jgi:hypothetical protein